MKEIAAKLTWKGTIWKIQIQRTVYIEMDLVGIRFGL